MATLKQEKAITELVANGGSIARAMRTAGYSKKTARTPKKLTGTKAYEAIVNPFLAELQNARQRAIFEINNKDLSKVSYGDLVNGVYKFNHDIQLLSGGKTENIGFEKERLELSEIIKSLRG